MGAVSSAVGPAPDEPTGELTDLARTPGEPTPTGESDLSIPRRRFAEVDAHDATILQDQLVVVVGTGDKVWELADRRLGEKGRLLVLLTDRAPERTYVDDGKFAWFPPIRKPPVGEQARQMVHWLN